MDAHRSDETTAKLHYNYYWHAGIKRLIGSITSCFMLATDVLSHTEIVVRSNVITLWYSGTSQLYYYKDLQIKDTSLITRTLPVAPAIYT